MRDPRTPRPSPARPLPAPARRHVARRRDRAAPRRSDPRARRPRPEPRRGARRRPARVRPGGARRGPVPRHVAGRRSRRACSRICGTALRSLVAQPLLLLAATASIGAGAGATALVVNLASELLLSPADRARRRHAGQHHARRQQPRVLRRLAAPSTRAASSPAWPATTSKGRSTCDRASGRRPWCRCSPPPISSTCWACRWPSAAASPRSRPPPSASRAWP